MLLVRRLKRAAQYGETGTHHRDGARLSLYAECILFEDSGVNNPSGRSTGKDRRQLYPAAAYFADTFERKFASIEFNGKA
jgi:hypothetical protein